MLNGKCLELVETVCADFLNITTGFAENVFYFSKQFPTERLVGAEPERPRRFI